MAGLHPKPFVISVGQAIVLIDGFVSGAWKITRHRSVATLIVGAFERLSKKDVAALMKEGAQLLAFAAADADTRNIQFGPPG